MERAARQLAEQIITKTRFRTYLRQRATFLGRVERLPPVATDGALNEVERQLGVPLPADLRALYLIADGDCDPVVARSETRYFSVIVTTVGLALAGLGLLALGFPIRSGRICKTFSSTTPPTPGAHRSAAIQPKASMRTPTLRQPAASCC